MVDTAKLKKEISQRCTNISEVAAQMGIDKATLYRRIADSDSFTIGEVDKLVSILALSASDAVSIFFANDVA